jgi:hypothetical protein
MERLAEYGEHGQRNECRVETECTLAMGREPDLSMITLTLTMTPKRKLVNEKYRPLIQSMYIKEAA